MRQKGLLVIAALVAVPVLATLATWWAWEAGAFDAPAMPGRVEVSALFRTGDTIGCSLRSTLPATDLVRYTLTPDGDTLVLRVTRRRMLAGKRAPRALQVQARLAPPCTRLELRGPGPTPGLQIWPPPPAVAPQHP